MSTFMGLFDSSMVGSETEQRGGEIRRYMFAIELNGTIGTKKEKGPETDSTYTWKPNNILSMYKKIPVGNDDDIIRQTLVIRRVILGSTAKEGESNWVNVEVSDPDGSDTKFPLAHLSKGQDVQTTVDLAFPDARDVNVTFTLAEGTGPVHVIGYHLFERIPLDPQDECEEDEMEEEELQDEREVTAKTATKVPVIRAKRRIAVVDNDDASVKKIKTKDDDEDMGNEAVAATNGDEA